MVGRLLCVREEVSEEGMEDVEYKLVDVMKKKPSYNYIKSH